MNIGIVRRGKELRYWLTSDEYGRLWTRFPTPAGGDAIESLSGEAADNSPETWYWRYTKFHSATCNWRRKWTSKSEREELNEWPLVHWLVVECGCEKLPYRNLEHYHPLIAGTSFATATFAPAFGFDFLNHNWSHCHHHQHLHPLPCLQELQDFLESIKWVVSLPTELSRI